MEAQRHLVLRFLQTDRYDLAIPMIRDLLSQDPEDPQLLGWYVGALWMVDEYQGCYEVSKNLLAIDGDNSNALYYHALSALNLNREAEAKRAMNAFLEADPNDPDAWYLQAAWHTRKHRPKEVLKATRQGLILDPEHKGLSLLKSQALLNLGKVDQSLAEIDRAQNLDPDEPAFHVSRGYAALRKRDRRQAREHFREALRLSPNDEHARKGMVEVLRSSNPLYRQVLSWQYTMTKYSAGQRIAIMIGALFLARILRKIAESAGYPGLGTAILVTYVLSCLMTFFIEPLTDLILLTSKDGRLVLKDEERKTAAMFATIVVIGGMLVVGGSTMEDSEQSLLHMMMGGTAVLAFIPVSCALNADFPRGRRRIMTVLAVLSVGSVIAGFSLIHLLGGADTAAVGPIVAIGLLAAILSTWFAA